MRRLLGTHLGWVILLVILFSLMMCDCSNNYKITTDQIVIYCDRYTNKDCGVNARFCSTNPRETDRTERYNCLTNAKIEKIEKLEKIVEGY